MLQSGGTLLTLQGGTRKYSPDLVDALEGTPPEWTQSGYEWEIDATLDEAGFLTVEKVDRLVSTTYHDIGAVVYFLKAVPWAIIDFDVDRYRDRLYKLHQRMQADGGFTVLSMQRLIEVRKP